MGKWKPMSELPDTCRDILLCDKYENLSVGYYAGGYPGAWISWDDDCIGPYVAWRELPKPPKGMK